MNINTISSSRDFTGKLSMETVSPASDQKNLDPMTKNLDPMTKAQTVQKSDNDSRLNDNKEKKDDLSLKEKQALVNELNDYMDDLQTNLGFSIHEKLDHQIVIEVKNRKTKELIKQIPSEELINIRVKMEELSGLILDAKA